MLHAHMHMYTRLKARARKMHDSPISFPATGKYPTVALYNPRRGSPRVDGEGKKNNTRNVDTGNTLVAGWLESRWWNQPRMETARVDSKGRGGVETGRKILVRRLRSCNLFKTARRKYILIIYSAARQLLEAAGVYALLRSFLPSSQSSRRPKDLFHVQSMFPAEQGRIRPPRKGGSFLSALPAFLVFCI